MKCGVSENFWFEGGDSLDNEMGGTLRMRKKNNNVILIVDRNPEELKLLALQDLGQIILATTGKRALVVAQKHKPDLLISNLNLATMTGIDLCHGLNKQKETSEIPVILLTQEDDARNEIAALEAGAVDFIKRTSGNPIVYTRVKMQLKLLSEKRSLRLLAEKDGLTEVYNRRYFEQQARIEIKRHYRQQQPLTLALLDLDHFKSYNDAYGHQQGDECLREVTQTVVQCTRRPGEFVARYGGEEFAVVLPNTNAHNAKKYGKWICEQVLALAIPHNDSTTVPFVTVSVGLATVVPSARTSLEGLVTTADMALYTAKQSGRNQFKLASIEHEVIREAG